MSNDLVNGIFEIFGALFTFVNIYKILQDKILRGVSYLPSLFFTSWSAWNIYYYPTLDQYWSFWGGVLMFSANAIWLYLAIYYTRRERRGNRVA